MSSQSQPIVASNGQPEAVRPAAWDGGKCRVPMWMMGCPAGHCDEQAFGPQLPRRVLQHVRGWWHDKLPYCFGPCCPKHGGPREGDPILFQDGLTPEGRQMWCAVMPGFINLQESEAGFDGDPLVAIAHLRASITKALGDSRDAEGDRPAGQLRDEPND